MHDQDTDAVISFYTAAPSHTNSSCLVMYYERTKKIQGTTKTISINWYIIRFWEENATTTSISFIPSNNYPKIL
jgi:hypothetical protein